MRRDTELPQDVHRRRRRIRLALGVFLALICVGSIVLQFNGRWAWIHTLTYSRSWACAISSYKGRLCINWGRRPDDKPGFAYEYLAYSDFSFDVGDDRLDSPDVSFLGFQYGGKQDPPRWARDSTFIGIPWWWISLFSGGPALPLLRWCRRHRYPVGCCQQCGYDLRAHKPGDRCPECGTPIPAGEGKGQEQLTGGTLHA